ncbi:MAG: urate hydroxylase PuuD, partial [Oceanospirillaceae bacterium]|nr:urate hydroxylase PuuD [Oceanospirillaceae bacterium]
MEAHLLEWLNLIIRWVHVIVGIAWIGASFYFVWLENNLDRQVKNQDLAGELWAIHGGGIYHLQKYKLAPATMPKHLHWFKWEAYSSWISGVLLLSVVYYLNAATYLILPGSPVSPAAGVFIGLGSLIMGWCVYDLLCKSALRHQPLLLGVALMVFL